MISGLENTFKEQLEKLNENVADVNIGDKISYNVLRKA